MAGHLVVTIREEFVDIRSEPITTLDTSVYGWTSANQRAHNTVMARAAYHGGRRSSGGDRLKTEVSCGLEECVRINEVCVREN